MFKSLKRYFSREKENIIKDSRFSIFKKYLRSGALWRMNNESVARGAGVGLFAAVLPIIPFQSLLAIFLSILFRANVVIAFFTSWLNNPFTFLPITYFTYQIGDWILGEESPSRVIETINWKLGSMHELWTSFSIFIVQFGKAYFIGLPILAIGLSVIGYLSVKFIGYLLALIKSIKT